MRAGRRFALLVVLALVAAAALALLANAVFAVEADFARPDGRVPSERGLRSRLAEGILGARDDRSFREAVALIEASREPGVGVRDVLERHGEAVVRLTLLARGGDDLARRSRAANLVGVLAFEDAALNPESAARYRELGLDALRRSVALDPGNEEAKFNLELVLAHPADSRPSPSAGDRSGRHGSTSAGSSPAGSGY